MSEVKALIVGESDYLIKRLLKDLPKCKNDVKVMKMAFVTGLCIPEENINIKENLDSKAELFAAIDDSTKDITNDDVFILYFTGHGGKNYLCLCKEDVEYKEITKKIRINNVKTAVFMIDCCHSGSFFIDSDIDSNGDNWFDNFAERGYALFASCGSSEECGSTSGLNVSSYTYLLYRSLVMGAINIFEKVAVEDINRAIMFWMRALKLKNVNPIYKSNILGTRFLSVGVSKDGHKRNDEFKKIYLNDGVIYNIEDWRTFGTKGKIKRYVYVISNAPLNEKRINEMFFEIKSKLDEMDILLEQKKPGIMICLFGNCEQDVLHRNFKYNLLWADDEYYICDWKTFQIKKYDNYKSYKDKFIESDNVVKNILDKQSNEIIKLAEQYRTEYRNYCNSRSILSEDKDYFINKISELNDKIENYCSSYEYGMFTSERMNKYAETVDELMSIVARFAYIYNPKYSQNYKSFLSRDIDYDRVNEEYNRCISKLKTIKNELKN